jgi:F-type H+-transporting ATPase subunit delta
VSAVAEAYRDLADEKLGRMRATVTSAIALDQTVARSIEAKLAEATKREVVVDRKIDPAIMGGVVAQVGSIVYDGSLRTQLEELRRRLKN